MNRLTQLKSNCIQTLERCIFSCQQLIVVHKHSKDLEKCIVLAQQCLDCCIECMDACESAQFDRGVKMHECFELCTSLKRECEKYKGKEFRACSDACSLCIEEFHRVLA